MKKFLIILLVLCNVIGVAAQTENSLKKKSQLSFGKIFLKQKQQNKETTEPEITQPTESGITETTEREITKPTEPEIKYQLFDSLKNGTVLLYPIKDGDKDIRNVDSLKYIYPDQSEITIYGKLYISSLYNEENNNFARIVYPDNSYYLGKFHINRFTGEIVLNWNTEFESSMHYKNGDLFYCRKGNIHDSTITGYYLKPITELLPQHFIVDDYDFFLPNYKLFKDGIGVSDAPDFGLSYIRKNILPFNADSLENIKNNIKNNPGNIYLLKSILKPNLGDIKMFWKTGSYPSVVIKENIKLIQQYCEENKTKLNEQLKNIPLNKYSGVYRANSAFIKDYPPTNSLWNAEYTYKELDEVRYKEGSIKCTTPDGFNLMGQYMFGKRTGTWTFKGKNGALIKGEYNNNRRIEKWTYKDINKRVVIESEANFNNGILVDDFLYCKVDELAGFKLTVRGQFTTDGIIDGPWYIEFIPINGNTTERKRITTYTYEDGHPISIEDKYPDTGAIIRVTKNGIVSKNFQLISRQNYYNSLRDRLLSGDIPTVKAMNIDSILTYRGQLFEYLSIWLQPLYWMENPNDNEFECKYYSKTKF